ncbi:hypothetical protein ACFLY8_01795 [Halobacteriota archaeon]
MKVDTCITKVDMTRVLGYPSEIAPRGQKISMKVNHTCIDPQKLDSDKLKSEHLLKFEMEDSNKNVIGIFDCRVTVVISEIENIDKIYKTWINKKYQNIPDEVRDPLEYKLTQTVFPPLTILSEKMGLPGIFPGIRFTLPRFTLPKNEKK